MHATITSATRRIIALELLFFFLLPPDVFLEPLDPPFPPFLPLPEEWELLDDGTDEDLDEELLEAELLELFLPEEAAGRLPDAPAEPERLTGLSPYSSS